MSTPNTFEESLRRHDAAVFTWLQGLHVDYGDISGKTLNNVAILTAFASPTRALAAVPDLLVTRNWIGGANNEEKIRNAKKLEVLPLPLVSIQRADPQPDTELASAPKQFRRNAFNPLTGKFTPHDWPGIYKTEYTLTFWGNKRYTDNFLREWVLSQLGTRGARNTETFIPVQHASPWGLLSHSLVFTGSTDESELEGEQDRFIRCAFTFELRTLLFRATPDELEPVNAIEQNVLQPSLAFGDLDRDGDQIDTFGRSADFSANLFVDPLTIFPTLEQISVAALQANFSEEFAFLTGATLLSSERIVPKDELAPAAFPTLRVDTETGADSVCLVERVVNKDDNDLSLIGTSFRYTATKAVTLEVRQKNIETGVVTTIYRKTLAASPGWKRVHFFTALTEPFVQVWLIGNAQAAVTKLFRFDVRNFSSGVGIAPDSVENTGGFKQYGWTTLPGKAFLVVAKVGSTAGAVTFEVKDDSASPTFSAQQSIDSSLNVSAVALMQPKTSSILAKVPNTTVVDSIFIQLYSGVFNGNE